MKASGVYQGEAMDFLTSRGRISGSVSRITLMVTMIDGGGGGGGTGNRKFHEGGFLQQRMTACRGAVETKKKRRIWR